MAESIAKLNAQVSLDVATWAKQESAFKKRLDGFARSVNQPTSSAGGSFGSLSRGFGGGSGVGSIGKILAGGGAVAGVTILSREITQAATTVGEYRRAYKAGEMSARDLAAESARAVPVLGDMIKAFDSIGQAFSDEPSAAFFDQQAAAQNAKNAEQEARLKKQISDRKQIDKLISEEQYKASLIGKTTEEIAQLEMDRALAKAAEDGASKKQLAQLRQTYETQTSLTAEGKRYAEYQEKLIETERRRREDFAYALDVQRELNAMKQAELEIDKENRRQARQLSAAVEFGSSAAYSTIAQAGARGARVTPGEREMIGVLRQIASGVRNNRVTTVDVL